MLGNGKQLRKYPWGEEGNRSEGHKLIAGAFWGWENGLGEQRLAGKVLVGHLKEIQGCYCMEPRGVERGFAGEGWFGGPVGGPL